MRILDDLTIFKKQEAGILDHWGNVKLSDAGDSPEYCLRVPYEYRTLDRPIYTSFFCKKDADDFHFQRRLHPDFLSIEFILSGETYLSCGIHGFVAEANDIVLLHPNLEHNLLALNGVPCAKYGICISGKNVVNLLKALNIDHVGVIHINDEERLRVIKSFEKIEQSLLTNGAMLDFDENAGATFELLQMLSLLKTNDPIKGNLDVVLRYFETHIGQKINMQVVANLIDKSLPTFNKMFLREMHITPYQYLINMRMQRAYKLLKEQKYSIKEVAAMSGYNSSLYFSTEFKKFHGKSPSSI